MIRLPMCRPEFTGAALTIFSFLAPRAFLCTRGQVSAVLVRSDLKSCKCPATLRSVPSLAREILLPAEAFSTLKQKLSLDQ